MKPLISIVIGSDSDLSIMSDAAKVLDQYKVPYEFTIVSAHRTPKRMLDFARAVEKRGVKVIIGGAGGAAHLPGMFASLTTLPVIGVPIKTKSLDGLDSLLSIVQMPAGIPVATVAINNAHNAALLALRILALSNPKLTRQLKRQKITMKSDVEKKAKKLEKRGYKNYLKAL